LTYDKESLASQIKTRLFNKAHILAIAVSEFGAGSAKNLFQIAHLLEYLWCDTVCENGGDVGENLDKAETEDQVMSCLLRWLKKSDTALCPPASIHQHDCRILKTKDNRIRIKL
jgi:hypothetical protein